MKNDFLFDFGDFRAVIFKGFSSNNPAVPEFHFHVYMKENEELYNLIFVSEPFGSLFSCKLSLLDYFAYSRRGYYKITVDNFGYMV